VNLLALPNIECLLIVSGMLPALSHLRRVLGKKRSGRDISQNLSRNAGKEAQIVRDYTAPFAMEPPKSDNTVNGLGKRATKLNMLFEKYVERIIQSVR
jgi:hypothetical protein